MAHYLKRRNLSYKDLNIGKFSILNKNRLDDSELSENEDIVKNKKGNDNFSFYQFYYLKKIIDLCNEANIDLIFISTPVYRGISDGYSAALNEIHQEHFKDVKFLDFSTWILPDSAYGDSVHLNYLGAELFSTYLEDNFDQLFLSL
jgi:hypothetical protein